jgi:hypothetical protein
MCFTDRFICGMPHRPDMRFVTINKQDVRENGNFTEESYVCVFINWSTYIDRLPIISNVSGATKLVLGLIHSIYYLALYIFGRHDRKEHNLSEIKIGIYNITRGAVLLSIPIFGSMLVYYYDKKRQNDLISTIETTSNAFERDMTILYECAEHELVRHPLKATADYEERLPNTTSEDILLYLRDGNTHPSDFPIGGIKQENQKKRQWKVKKTKP